MMSNNNFVRIATIAEKLHDTIEKGLPDRASRIKADTAMVVINTLARLSPRELAQFHDAMVDYIALDEQGRTEALSRLSVKITEVKIG